jgi:hypothetical protein
MLSATTLGYLSTLTYRADARRQVCWWPLKGIYWDDELPRIHCLTEIPAQDRAQILWLFGIRVRIWKGETLPEEDQQFWDATESQVAGWAFFQRQKVSAHDRQDQEQVERETSEALTVLVADADEVRISEEDGIQGISLVFDLTKEHSVPRDNSWWKCIFRRRQPDQ